MHDDHNSPRDRQRLQWARSVLSEPDAGLVRASVDAGFRSYWRSEGAGPSRILMDSPPDREDVRPWLQIRDLLETGGVRVPRVLARDLDRGFLLLEDLGAQTLLQAIEADGATDVAINDLFGAAIDQLLALQSIEPPAGFPTYDDALLARELHLFDQWFLGHHLGMVLDCGELETLELAYRQLINAALAQAQVLVHRDYMPRNLMPVDGTLAVLDFQDAVRGPIAYDPLSLFKDAFHGWPQARIDPWLGSYHARASAAGLPVPGLQRFRRDVDWIGVQRHLKVIGIFARLQHRDGKPKYLADVPRFFDYLDGVLPRYPELDGLRTLIDTRVKPAMASA